MYTYIYIYIHTVAPVACGHAKTHPAGQGVNPGFPKHSLARFLSRDSIQRQAAERRTSRRHP